MIDNNYLVYAGVLMVFMIGAIAVALIGALLLAAGFAVALTVRFHQRRSRRKPERALQTGDENISPPAALDDEDGAVRLLPGTGSPSVARARSLRVTIPAWGR